MNNTRLENKETNYGMMVQAAALSVAVLMYTSSMTTPALGEIAKAFPNETSESIQLISSIPSLILVVFSLISGWLSSKISIKKCILISSIFMLAGAFPAFIGDFKFLLVTRVIYGIGYGIVAVMAQAVITDLFDGKKREKMIGYNNASGAMAGVVFQTFGGFVAAYNWRYTFLGFLVAIPIMILIWTKLPETPVNKVDQTGEKISIKDKYTSNIYVVCIVTLLVWILSFTFLIDMAMYMGEGNVGTAANAANALSIVTLVAFVIGLAYGKFVGIFKQYLSCVSILFFAVGFIIASRAQSVAVYYVAAIVYGVGFGSFNPTYTLKAASSVKKPEYTPMAISFFICAMGLGQFLSPYIMLFIKNTFNLGSIAKVDWVIASVLLIVIGAVDLITTKMKNSNVVEEQVI